MCIIARWLWDDVRRVAMRPTLPSQLRPGTPPLRTPHGVPQASQRVPFHHVPVICRFSCGTAPQFIYMQHIAQLERVERDSQFCTITDPCFCLEARDR